jgi:F-type H+-transporting ATPase subunit a
MNTGELGGGVVFHLGPLAITDTVLSTWGVMLCLAAAALLLRYRLAPLPSRRQTIAEGIVAVIERAIGEVLPADAVRRVLPFVATLWIFVLTANLAGLIPGLHAPTRDLSATAALAALVFASTHWYGIRSKGLRAYLRHYAEPSLILLPFHVISELTRTLALAIRPLREHHEPGDGRAAGAAHCRLPGASALVDAACDRSSGAGLYLRHPGPDLYCRRHRADRHRGNARGIAAGHCCEIEKQGGIMNELQQFSMLSTIVAGVVIALGTMLPAIAMGRAIASALEALARQPEAEKTITRTLFIGLAMIESLAIYCLVIALIVLFRNPLLEYFLK